MKREASIFFISVVLKGPAMKWTSSKDYPAQVINWATHHEGLSLAAGRKLFGDRAVLGGFVNGKKGLLYQGEREAIEQRNASLGG